MGLSARNLVVQRGSFTLKITELNVGARGMAVLGSNGAGKTSLLQALQGLLPSAGTIDLAGRAATVFARPAVLRGPVLWNVSVVARSVRGLAADEAEQCARRTLNQVGLSERERADARTLSTGERQRLAIARALVCEPQLLFLDEPFANVDAESRPALRSIVSSYCAQAACTLIIATSFLADAAALSDELIVLDHGAMTYRGAVQDLSTSANPYVRALIAESRI